MVVSDEYSLSGRRTKDIDDDTVSYIQRRLQERSALKADRDYAGADMIRDELRDNFNVKIDDRTREYSFVIDEFSVVESNNDYSEITPNRVFRSKLNQQNDDEIPDSLFEFLDDVPGKVVTDIDDTNTTPDDVPTEDDTVDVAPPVQANYSSMTVVQLKDLLRENGLPVSGNKAELISRLQTIA
jgi:SAP domain